jgi:hypothetical protein
MNALTEFQNTSLLLRTPKDGGHLGRRPLPALSRGEAPGRRQLFHAVDPASDLAMAA